MKNRIFFFAFLWLSSLCIPSQGPLLEFVSIDCPAEIVIPENMVLKNFEVLYHINLKYLGDDVEYDRSELICDIALWSNDLKIQGDIYYVDKDNKILPGALARLYEYGIDLGGVGISRGFVSQGITKFAVLEKNEIYSWPFFLVSDWGLFDITDIDEAIKAKRLSRIVLIIKKVELEWEVSGCKKNPRGKIELEINRIKIIPVRYESKADANPGG